MNRLDRYRWLLVAAAVVLVGCHPTHHAPRKTTVTGHRVGSYTILQPQHARIVVVLVDGQQQWRYVEVTPWEDCQLAMAGPATPVKATGYEIVGYEAISQWMTSTLSADWVGQ